MRAGEQGEQQCCAVVPAEKERVVPVQSSKCIGRSQEQQTFKTINKE